MNKHTEVDFIDAVKALFPESVVEQLEDVLFIDGQAIVFEGGIASKEEMLERLRKSKTGE